MLKSGIHLLLGLLLLPIAVQAQEPFARETLLLDATLNGTSTGQLLTVIHAADGSFRARADELAQLRIRIDRPKIVDGLVDLATLPDLAFHYDEAKQAIDLRAIDALLDPYQVRLGASPESVDLSAIRSTPGAIVNYGVYALKGGGASSLSGSVEAIGMTPAGIFSTNGLFNTQNSLGGHAIVRLDSSWRFIDAPHVRSYTIGDFASNALAWTSSTRLAGFQIASAFEQRSDIVTTALPQFSGSAALPSTLDLYVNQQRVFSGDIPSGPFDIKALPFVSGADVRLITTDATGRQIEVNKSYYYVPGQLRKGLLEYSLDIGLPRRSYGIKSFDYDDVIFVSASGRYGITGRTTLEGHFEASGDALANAGIGIVQSIGGFGAVTGSLAASNYKSRSGTKFAIQAEGNLRGIRFYAGTERASADYFDLARLSALRDARRLGLADPGYASLITSTAEARAIDRAGISFTPWFDRTSINLSYNAIKGPQFTQRIANLTLSRTVSDRISAYVSGYGDLNDRHRYGLFATLNIRLSPKVDATVGIDREDARTAYSLQVEGLTGQRQGDVGWGVSDREVDGDGDQRSAYVSYRAASAYLRAHVEQSGSQTRGGVDVEGSIVAAGGGFFLANRIGDGFVIVKNAGPGSGVMQGGVAMGNADGAGRMLLPDIQPYYAQHIFLDPATTADGWEPQATERIAITAYRQGAIVDFGAARVEAAVLVLRDRAGKPIPAGYMLQLDGGGGAVVGYDGEAYVRGLKPGNRLSIDLGMAGICTASFAYDMHGPAQPRIGPLICE